MLAMSGLAVSGVPAFAWPDARIGFGADYNPEQWPRGTWPADVALDARGRDHLRHRRCLRLVVAGTGAGCLHLRLARRGARPAALRRDRRRPGYGHRLAAPVVLRRAPRDAARGPRGPHPLAGFPPDLVPELADVHRGRDRADRAARAALREPPGAGAVARLQRVRLPQRSLLLRHLRGGLPDLARRALRRAGRAERGVGHGLLEPALHRPGAGAAAAHLHRPAQPDAPAGLPPVHLRRAAGPVPGRTRRAASALARRAGHHELHDARPLPRSRLPPVGARGRRGGHRPLHRQCPRRPRGRARLRRRPHPGAGRRRAVAAHGAQQQRGELAAGQPRQGAGTAPAPQPHPRRARRGHRGLLPVAAVAGRGGEVPLGVAPARGRRQQDLARGARAGPGVRRAARGGRFPRRGPGGAAVGLPGGLGAGRSRAPLDRAHLRCAGPRPARGPAAGRHHHRRGAPGHRPRALRPRRRAHAVPVRRRRPGPPHRGRRRGRATSWSPSSPASSIRATTCVARAGPRRSPR